MKKIMSIFWSIFLIILIIAIICVGVVVYMEFNGDSQIITQIVDVAVEEPEQNKKNTAASNIIKGISDSIQSSEESNEQNSNIVIQISDKYFYNQLNENQKIIYSKLTENKENLKQGNYVIDFGDTFSEILTEPNGSDTLGDEYQAAIEAFVHDNVDLFYLDINKMYLNIETTTKFLRTTYNVYISAATDSTYLLDDFSGISEINSAINQIETVKMKILRNLNGTAYQNILAIHDYLVDNIEYDSTYNAKGSYSIYGALIGKTCVCEGYAKAFKYLVNAAGYQCEFMQGTAINSSGENESHAWNCVQLENGNWYLVDVTWDDPIITGNRKRCDI